jgi:hypothetical protein
VDGKKLTLILHQKSKRNPKWITIQLNPNNANNELEDDNIKYKK